MTDNALTGDPRPRVLIAGDEHKKLLRIAGQIHSHVVDVVAADDIKPECRSVNKLKAGAYDACVVLVYCISHGQSHRLINAAKAGGVPVVKWVWGLSGLVEQIGQIAPCGPPARATEVSIHKAQRLYVFPANPPKALPEVPVAPAPPAALDAPEAPEAPEALAAPEAPEASEALLDLPTNPVLLETQAEPEPKEPPMSKPKSTKSATQQLLEVLEMDPAKEWTMVEVRDFLDWPEEHSPRLYGSLKSLIASKRVDITIPARRGHTQMRFRLGSGSTADTAAQVQKAPKSVKAPKPEKAPKAKKIAPVPAARGSRPSGPDYTGDTAHNYLVTADGDVEGIDLTRQEALDLMMTLMTRGLTARLFQEKRGRVAFIPDEE